MRIFCLIAVFLTLSLSGFSQNIKEADFKKHFDKYGVEGCFILFDQSENSFTCYNSELCDSGFIPASTFKIPHSLIALEEGVIKDTFQIIKWDGHQWPASAWNHDQTLRSAVKSSVVWVYSGFTEQIDIDRYYYYINAFDYGNKNLIGQPDKFWLAGLLRISARQQIEFLRKFYNYQLPVSRESIDIVKKFIILEENDSCRFSGKTGGGMLSDDEYIMWLVGYLEKDSKVYFYAMNFRTDDFDKTSQARYNITNDILTELKLIE